MTPRSDNDPKWKEFETNDRGFYEAYLWNGKLLEYYVIPPLEEGF